jgi:Protein of unknown function (DUF742)
VAERPDPAKALRTPHVRRRAGDEAGPSDDAWEIEAGIVRPYVFTQGRTRAASRSLTVEAMVRTTASGRQRPDGIPPEQRSIVALCTAAQSVAEVAAKLHTPLGVVRVLVADLTDAGLLEVFEVFEGATDLAADVELLQRLIARVKAIPA